MENTEGSFQGLNDDNIYFQSWSNAGEIKGVVLISHGFGEHSGRYINVVNTLVPEGYIVYALDHRGHGKSEGKRVHVNQFTDYFEDFKTFENIVRDKHPDLPFHLLGHSMGSIIANNYMKMYADQSKFKSIILSGTGSAPGPDINGVTLFMSKIFSFIFPKLILPSNLDPNFISYDDEVVNAYKSDPLVKYDKISARLGAEMFKFLGKMREAANGISIPVLIQFGSEDQAFHPDSRIPLKEAFSSKSVDFKMYEGFRHEVYNELKKEQPLGDLKDWINKHN